MPTDPEKPARPLRRPLPLRYVLVLIVTLFAVPIITWLIWGRIEASRLDRVLDALEARHEPLDLKEFGVKPTTAAEKEAAHLYAEAGKLIDDRAIPTAEAARLSGIIGELCTPSSEGPSQATQVQALQTFEEAYVKAFELIDLASPLKAVGWDDGGRPQRQMIQDMRPITLGRANVARIARLACTGNTEGAAAALLSSLRMRRIWISTVVPPPTARSLELTLASGQPSAAVLREIQDEYESAVDDRTFENWMVSPRRDQLQDL
jgi:hypothetical protein